MPGLAAAPPGARAWLAAHPGIALALLGCLGLLLAHAWHYRFLCDDAFISFRYARNLALGDGLVFNPGLERVEGYSNLLWVLLLAGLHRLGAAPEHAAPAVSLLATVALWALVAREAVRLAPPAAPAWIVVVPVLALAATRSVAVWSTGGLETRLFEVLVVAGAFRLAGEVEALAAGRARRPVAGLLFGLAAATRPDGALLAGCAFGAAALHLARRGRLEPARLAALAAPLAAIVAAVVAFRRAYYGAWLPNTWYAKIDGRTWWDSGLDYLGAFALEYAAWLWVPFLLLGAVGLAERGRGFVPLLIGALLVPYLAYVAAIGGDHFEFRPLDLVFPFAFLLIAAGLQRVAHPRAGPLLAAAAAALVLGLWQLPHASHRQAPRAYVAGFPGTHAGPEGDYLDPARDPIYRLPGLRRLAEEHRRLLGACTARFVGIRQEEHRLFLATVRPVGLRLAALVRAGRVPADLHLAMPCVGAIPYDSDLPVLDRLGLTDAGVARQQFARREQMGHDKHASLDYVRARGADLWTEVRPIGDVTSADFLFALERTLEAGEGFHAADLGDGTFLVGRPAQGAAHLARRVPRLRFEPMDRPEFLARFVDRSVAAYRAQLAAAPGDETVELQLALVLAAGGRPAEALAIYRRHAERRPDDAALWIRVGGCHAALGERAAALAALERGLEAARACGDLARQREIETLGARLAIGAADPGTAAAAAARATRP